MNNDGSERAAMLWLKQYMASQPCSASATVQLTNPSQNMSITIPDDVEISAEVSDPDEIETLQFFVNGNQVGETEYLAPYSTTVSITNSGEYEVYALITMPNGDQISSNSITITANVPRSPYGNTAHIIPGVIQVEDYDLGGQGVAYNDTDPVNEGGAIYRNDGVDIENSTDVTGEFNIGYSLTGEWLAYTVDVQSTGLYNLSLRVATEGDGKSMHVEIDGQNVTGAIGIPNTEGWQIWETITVENLQLTHGEHDMRIVFDSDYINVNFVEFKNVITGLNKNTLNELAIFPNPTTTTFNVLIPGDFEYTVYNSVGKIIEAGEGSDKKEIGQSMKLGIYVISINNGVDFKSFKITKE